MMLAFIFTDVGFGEWFVLLAVVLIVVGPRKLPSAARKLGSIYGRFRRAAEGFKRQVMEMETEIDATASAAEKGLDEAFKIEGDEAKAVPLAWDEGQPAAPAGAADEPQKG